MDLTPYDRPDGFPAMIEQIDEHLGGLTDHAKRVATFLLKGGQAVPLVPTMPDSDVRRLRCLLLLEETLEFIAAAGFELDLHTIYRPACKVGERFGYSVYETGDAPAYEGMIDACADISVVNTGTLLALGAGDERVLESVDAANLAKVSGDVQRDVNGKIKKPEGWTPPTYQCVEDYGVSVHHSLQTSPFTDDFGEGIPLLQEMES